MKTRIVISFDGPQTRQVPYLMIIKEFRDENNKVAYAEVLYLEQDRESQVVFNLGEFQITK